VRNSKMMIAGLSVLAALALACGAGEAEVSDGGGAPAGAGDTAEKAPVLEKKVGETVAVSSSSAGIEYTITKTQQKQGGEFNKAKNGTYLLGYLEIKVTKGNAYVCGCETSFIGPDGTVYEYTWALIDGYDELTAADVAAGQKVAGWVSFDVPKKALKGGKIQLKVTNFFSEDKYAYWAL
jgi:hypothetical protein